ncbi:hypothetical protein H0H87_010022 [Tephrocybe sp. NHM501043]|nr:hypothetical protein H0H87_010022 [Tephrocybe sp. NHM501043]
MADLDFTAVVDAQVTDPDRALRIAQAVNYPNRAWFCVAAFIGLITLYNIAYRISQFIAARRTRQLKATPARGTIVWTRLPLATVNAFRAIVFRSTFRLGPFYSINVAELFLTSAYITLVFVWSLVNTTNSKGVKYDPKYWANIAAHVATTQLPLMTALGTKNNIISYLTGICYEKLDYLHRMTARVLCVLIWVHAAGRIKIGMVGTYAFSVTWVQCGLLAATAFTVLCIASLRPIRKRNYEYFLMIHFVMAFITLLGGYFHSQGIQEGYHVWPAFIIWGLDRLIRTIRVLVYNSGYFKKGSPKQRGHFDVLSPHFIRLTLQGLNHLHWRPGQSAYLRIPDASSSMFESHPFTIATIYTPLEDHATGDHEKDEVSKELDTDEPEKDRQRLSFLIRVRGGFTKRLLDAVDRRQEMNVVFEGPYGSPPRLRGFDTVVLIAGGSGVSFTLPLLLDVIQRAKQGATDCQKVVFIWAIRDTVSVDWVMNVIVPMMANTPPHLTVEIHVHITTASTRESCESMTEQGSDEESKVCNVTNPNHIKFPGVTVVGGRPDLEHILEQEIAQSSGALSFSGR